MTGLILAGLAIAWAPPPAAAGSQSSNSSSNCSNGRCTVWESYVEEDGRRRLGWESLRAWPAPGGWWSERPGWRPEARPRRGDDDDRPRRRWGRDDDD